MSNEETTQKSFAKIRAYYRDKVFESIALELIPQSDNVKLILAISEEGSNNSTLIKFPTSDKSFIVFSKAQLDETLFEIIILDEETQPVQVAADGEGKITLVKS